MRKVLTVFFVLLGVFSCANKKDQTLSFVAAKDNLVSKYSFEAVDGKFEDKNVYSTTGEEVSLNSLVGDQKTVVIFFATWCPWCQKEVGELAAFKTRAGDNIKFIGISLNKRNSFNGQNTDSSDEEAYKFIDKFKTDYNLNFDLYWSKDNMEVIGEIYKVQSFPTVYLIDKKNNVFLKKTGYSSWEAEIK